MLAWPLGIENKSEDHYTPILIPSGYVKPDMLYLLTLKDFQTNVLKNWNTDATKALMDHRPVQGTPPSVAVLQSRDPR